MRNFTRLVSHALRVGIAAGALLAAAPAAAVPVTGSFTAQIVRIDGDDVAASPFFPDQALLTGAFGYDTDAAQDADPDPTHGLYTFDDTAFLSITVNGATYATDPALGPISVVLSIFPGNQNFQIRGGLVPEAEGPLATADVPLELTLVNGLGDDLFLPDDALPTSTFSLATFSDPDGIIGGAGATPYLVFFQLRSLAISAASPVPAPGAMALLGLGMLTLAGIRRRSAAWPAAGRYRPPLESALSGGPLRGLRIDEPRTRIRLGHLVLRCLKAERGALVRRVRIGHAQDDRHEGGGDHQRIDDAPRRVLDRL